MVDDFDTGVANLLAGLDTFCRGRDDKEKALEPTFKGFHKATEALAPSWSGSWLGHHANLYYDGFKRPPPPHRFNLELGTMYGLAGKWLDVPFDALVAMLEKQVGARLDDLFAAANRLRDEAKRLQDEFLVAVAAVRGAEGFEAETKLVDEIDSTCWGSSAEDFAKYQMPTNYMTRDSKAMAEGLRVPPHIMVDANVRAVQSRLGSVTEFCTKSRRTLRQIQAKRAMAAAKPTAQSAPADTLTQICKGFHRAARQLRVRHQKRPTIEMDDEYDVQDLLHAFLVLHFKDVRAEEYSPSYAGGNARMDFLLKNERIVVEVKRTRDGLGDKEIGTQLIVDIARYRAHPDCRLLLCFVYDPEGRIGNPRGLESDLAALAGPDFKVVVLIEPS